jgi:hypothetical protein
MGLSAGSSHVVFKALYMYKGVFSSSNSRVYFTVAASPSSFFIYRILVKKLEIFESKDNIYKRLTDLLPKNEV